MTQAGKPETGPSEHADTASVPQSTGLAASDAAGGDEPDAREVGVTAAVERNAPTGLSDEGDPVRDNPHSALDDHEPAPSTDDL
jgi:hypothetical protein